ncbi:MAG: HPr family phosphocarrier protein [Kofleriaceae bacterium]
MSEPARAEKQVLVQNERGLHARAATQFVQLAAKFPCEVQISKDTTEVNGKSIMGVLMLVATKGTTLTIKAKGDRAAECVDALAALVNDKFGEVK